MLKLSEKVLGNFFSRFTIGNKNECWQWKGVIINYGYGRFFYPKHQQAPAHRVVYELFFGPIPDGQCIDHLCRVRNCVNPFHMEQVSNRENVLRGVGLTAKNASKTHCKRGHPLVGDNLRLSFSSYQPIHRVCRQCVNERARKYRAAIRKAMQESKA